MAVPPGGYSTNPLTSKRNREKMYLWLEAKLAVQPSCGDMFNE
jgi:hypothetical protein